MSEVGDGLDLPFADPADVVELTDTLFTDDDISSWARRELQDTELAMPVITNVIPLRREPKPESKPTQRAIRAATSGVPNSESRPPPPLRRRLRYQVARSFVAPAVSMAPAARSTMRFSEHSAISDAGGSSGRRLAEVVGTIVAAAILIWMFLAL